MPETRVTKTATYHGRFELDPSGQWLAEIEELPAVHTFARTLGKAREYLIDALALWLDLPAESVRPQMEFQTPSLPAEVEESVQRAIAEREIAESVIQVASAQTTEAALALVRTAHLSLRDAADILGISHQRVQQLVSAAEADNPNTSSGALTAAEEVASALREYLPGGSKEDLGKLAAAAALGLAIVWLESRAS
jgi:predicted RNase H-like HicB family nuclease